MRTKGEIEHLIAEHGFAIDDLKAELYLLDADDDDDMQSIIDADDNERELDMNNTIMFIGGGL